MEIHFLACYSNLNYVKQNRLPSTFETSLIRASLACPAITYWTEVLTRDGRLENLASVSINTLINCRPRSITGKKVVSAVSNCNIS